jgi:type IV pilus assembly protein PilM
MDLMKVIFQRQIVGLDIGVSGIKAVELAGKRNPRLLAYNRVPLPRGTIMPDGDIKGREVVVSALKKLFEFKQFTTKRVAVGASGNSVMTKKISVPKMKREELQQQLYWEAEQYIPFNIEEVNLDFAILGPTSAGSITNSGSPMIDIMLVAAKKDYIQLLHGVMEEAGLSIDVIDNQSFALGNAFEFNYGHIIDSVPGSTSIIIDLGAGSTKVSVVEGDKTTFTRELRQCGIVCTDLLAERLGVSAEQAEKLKLTEAESPAVKAILAEFSYSISEEIRRTLDFWASGSPDRNVQGVYICGGASKTEGLISILESKLPAPVQPLNPIQNVVGSGKRMNAQAIRELSYLGAVAIGLSIRAPGDTA